jgi:hypothetical protein
LINRRRHSGIADVRSFRAADCDADNYLVVAKVKERLAVSKQTEHRVHMQRINFKKSNETGQNVISCKILNRFEALENQILRWMFINLGNYYREYQSFCQRESSLL